MAVVTAVLFVLALTFATTNGWWYVSSYGIPFSSMPKIAGISIQRNLFGAVRVVGALYGVAARHRPPPRRAG